MQHCTRSWKVCQRKRINFSGSGKIPFIFHSLGHIVSGVRLKGVVQMQPMETGIDLDDLIFSENDGQPSDR